MLTALEPVVSVDLFRAAKRSEETPMWMTDDMLRQAEQRYRRFLALCIKHPDRPIAPSKDIDMMWHLHMLNPRAYYEDCQQMFGDILDHDGGFGADPAELPILEQTFAETAALYREEFGEEYVNKALGDVAGVADAMTRCTRNCVSRCQRACKTK
jgi:hypothetical protein